MIVINAACGVHKVHNVDMLIAYISIHDHTIKSDTGQHSQFLQCFPLRSLVDKHASLNYIYMPKAVSLLVGNYVFWRSAALGNSKQSKSVGSIKLAEHSGFQAGNVILKLSRVRLEQALFFFPNEVCTPQSKHQLNLVEHFTI